jgi:precorrin-3B synthase
VPDDPESEDLLALAATAATSYAGPANGPLTGQVPALRARPSPRTRNDRCPGALRPWQAADGLLVRLRLIGGRVTSASLKALLNVAEEYGDGRIHVTVRANLQVRALPGGEGSLVPEALAAIEETGLLPARGHELVRNIMCSPQAGLAGGRADLRPAAAELDARLCAEERLAGLPGRFLFVLDDGRGDLTGHGCDLGLTALDSDEAQLRLGADWGSVVPVGAAPALLAALAGEFLLRRGSGPAAPWHVKELPVPLRPAVPPDPRLPSATGPLPYGPVPGGRHVAVPGGGLDRAAVARLTAGVPEVIVTPWRGVFVPEEISR